VRSLVEAIQKIPSAIAQSESDLSSYDRVVIGTPVWAWSVSSPVRAYLMANKGHLPELDFADFMPRSRALP
jgi:menaquinone-dependent protoporphyrinogen IX oxidase